MPFKLTSLHSYPLLLKLAIALLVMGVMLFASLSLLVQHGLVFSLTKMGVEAEIERLQLKLFEGRLHLQGLRTVNAQGRGVQLDDLLVDLRLAPLWNRHVVVEKLAVQGLHLDVVDSDQGLELGGILLPPSPESQVPPRDEVAEGDSLAFDIHALNLSDSEVCLDVRGITPLCTSLDELQLRLQGRLDQQLVVTLPGFALSRWRLQPTGKPATQVSVDALSWDQLELEGPAARLDNLQLQGFKSANGEGRRMHLDSLLADVQVRQQDKRQILVERLALQGLYLDVLENDAGLELGGIVLPSGKDPAPASPGGKPAEAQSLVLDIRTLSFDDIEICVDIKALKPLCSALAALQVSLQGQRDQQLAMQVPEFKLSDWSLRPPGQTQPLLSLDDVTWQQLEVDGGRVQLDGLQLQGARALPRDAKTWPYHLQFQQLELASLSYQQAVELGPLSVQRLEALLERNSDGSWEAGKRLRSVLLRASSPQQPASQEPQGQATKPQAKQPLAYSLAGLTLKDSHLGVIDGPNKVRHDFSRLNLELGALDSRQPTQSTTIELHSSVGEFGELQLAGWLQPLGRQLSGELSMDLEGFDLVDVSPYVEPALGNSIDRGVLNHKFKALIKEGQLDVKNELQLEKFEVSMLSQQEKLQSGADDSMPLNMALELLRDSRDRIELKLPVKGRIGDPSLSLTYVLGVVFRKALTQAVISYYTPFGLFSVTKGLVEGAIKMRFQPLAFEPGKVDIDRQARVQLDKLAALLKDRPQMALVFCPRIGEQEWRALWPEVDQGAKGGEKPPPASAPSAEQLAQLKGTAEQRGDDIKKYLRNQGVKSKQVVLCKPEWQADETTVVDVFL